MPAVIVDFGADAPPDRVAWVLDACNAAITAGQCVAQPSGSGEAPRAVAIVRVRDTEGRIVRIEVGLREHDQASWSLRELEFSSEDPPSERWRSVGLALATLVGEIEESEAAREAEAAADPPKPSPLPPPPTPGAPRSTHEAVDLPPSDRTIEPSWARPEAFASLGVLVGQGTQGDPLRWGGGGRVGWVTASGLQISVAGDYSVLALDQGSIGLGWLRFFSGIGYRFWLHEDWSAGLSLHAGVRHLGAEVDSSGDEHTVQAWSPMGLGSVDTWWQVTRFGGLSLSLDLSSIGKETRLKRRSGEPPAVIPLGEATGQLGVWWAL